MAKVKSIPVLDIPRLAKDDYRSTVAALSEHRTAAFPGVTYNKYRANLPFAVERVSDALRAQAIATFARCRSDVEAKNNRECFELTEGLYTDRNSRCWVLPALQLEDQTGLVLRMPQSVVRYDTSGKYSALVFPQPRKSFVPTEEELALLGVLIRRAWIPSARDTLFAPYPDMHFIVEFVDLASQRRNGPRVPRLMTLNELPSISDEVVSLRMANLSRALRDEPPPSETDQPEKKEN